MGLSGMSREREYMRVVSERGKIFGRINNDGYTGKGALRGGCLFVTGVFINAFITSHSTFDLRA